MKQAICL